VTCPGQYHKVKTAFTNMRHSRVLQWYRFSCFTPVPS